MSNYFLGTLTPSPLVRGLSGDTFGTHHSVLGVGGFMEVRTISERNLLPIDGVNGMLYDGISSGQRRLGMLVYVYEDKCMYQLTSPVLYSVWNTYTSLQKQTALADNNNWVLFSDTTYQSYNNERIWKKFKQTTHGFSVGNVIGFNGSNFVKSSSTNALIVEPLGIVTEVIDSSNFNLTYCGYISTVGMTNVTGGTLVSGKLYYVSPTAGKLTLTEPSTLSDVSKPMLATLSGNTGIILQYNGKKILENGLSYNVFSAYTATTQVFLNKAVTGGTNIGFFSGLTGQQQLKIDKDGCFPCNGIYNSLYNYYYRDNAGIIRIGACPYDGHNRQGYLKNEYYLGVAFIDSWIWNECLDHGGQVGWMLVRGNVTENVGKYAMGLVQGSGFLNVTWTPGYAYYDGNTSVLATGSTSTGTSYNFQGPIYSDKVDYDLRFRTIVSRNPDSIQVSYDDDCVYLSGGTEASSSIFALNGLTKSGSVIILGGALTGETKISDTSGIGVQYSADYSSTFLPHSLIDKNYADNKSGDLTIVNVSSSTYNATPLNKAIGGRSNPSGCTIFLPAFPISGRPVIVYDKDGFAGTTHNNNITVNGNTNLILGWNSAAINTDFGSITFMYNGVFWSVIAFTAAPSYSI